MIRRRSLVAALAGLLVAACGSGSATPSPAPTASVAPSVQSTPAASPSAAASSAVPPSAVAPSAVPSPTGEPTFTSTLGPTAGPASPPAASPSPAASPLALTPGRLEPETAWDRVAQGIGRDGTVPLETALEAFALLIGPLPGVETPSGEAPAMSSGSAAVRWLIGHWDELRPEQQAAAAELLGAPAGEGSAADAADAGLIAVAGTVPGLIGDVRVAQAAPSCAVEPSDPKVARLREELAAVGPTLAEKLKRTLGLPVVFALGNIIDKDGKVKSGIAAETTAMDASCQPATGRPAYCRIQVTERGQGLEGFELRHVVAHELFHCHQYDFATSAGAAGRVAPWLAEGSAAWVGEVIAGGSTVGEEFWTPWLREPQRPLFTQDYGGIGFFMHLADSGVDPWPLLVPMHLKGESSSADAYAVAAKAKGAPGMIDAWGPSFMQDNSGGGNDWRTNGPGLPLGIQPPSSQEALGSTDSYILSVGPQAGWAARFDVRSDVVVLEGRSSRGLVRFADGSQRALADVLGRPLCVKAGGCSCPSGSAGAAHQWLTAAPGPMLVGVSGHTDGAHVIVDGFDVDTTCEHKPDDFKPQEPCFCPPGPLGGLGPAVTAVSGSLRRLPRGRGPRVTQR